MQNVVVNIFPSVIEDLKISSLNHSPNETGGILIGTRSFHEMTLEYNILGYLCVADYDEFKDIYRATKTGFVCVNREGWAKVALKAVERFGMSYIGDWHSHPKSSMKMLSSLELCTLYQQYKLEQFSPYPPLHLLVHWLNDKDISVKANVLLNEILLVMKPSIIRNR